MAAIASAMTLSASANEAGKDAGSENPFFHYKEWKTPHGTYPFNEIKDEHYMPAFEEAMRRGMKEIDDICANPAAPTFANTIEAYENAGEMLNIVIGCFFNLASAETNDAIQAIQVELTPKLSEYSSTIRLNEKLFERIKPCTSSATSSN